MSRDLAAELMAHDWAWVEGARLVQPDGTTARIVDVYVEPGGNQHVEACSEAGVVGSVYEEDGYRLDLTDAATVGCLQGLLGRNLRNVYRAQWRGEIKWTVSTQKGDDVLVTSAPTLGEALALALLDVGPEVVDG